MTGISKVGNAMHLGLLQNKTPTGSLAGRHVLPADNTNQVDGAPSQINFKITDISANTLARIGNELHSKGQIDAETHLMMTLPRLGSAAMHVGGLPANGLVLGGPTIEDPEKNIDMLQYAKDKLDYMKWVNEKYHQEIDTKPWERFINTLEELDGKEGFVGIDLTA